MDHSMHMDHSHMDHGDMGHGDMDMGQCNMNVNTDGSTSLTFAPLLTISCFLLLDGLYMVLEESLHHIPPVARHWARFLPPFSRAYRPPHSWLRGRPTNNPEVRSLA